MGSECKSNLLFHAEQQQQAGAVAPFVAKTFHMVSDPATDAIVRWGAASNTFLVVDPAAFSDYLLPSYFKHRNFASFVRQLNTYGFRKVDADRWEFAHESFLRGQTRLLPLIARKKKRCGGGGRDLCEEGEEVRGTIEAVQRLRHEQRGMEEELQAMDRRLQAAETRPGQMMAFLAKLADDPAVVLRAMLAKKEELAAGAKGGSPPPPREAPGKRRRIDGNCGGGAGEMAAQGVGAVQFPFSVPEQVFYY